jgi:hypothetical protein
MRRERLFDELDHNDERQRFRAARVQVREEDEAGEAEAALAAPELLTADLPDALLALCHRFRLEAWASNRDDRGLWAFGLALAQWLEQPANGQRQDPTTLMECVRLVTNLLIIIGAVTRPPQQAAPSAIRQATGAVATARHAIASGQGPIASFPGAARATERLVRVRGWARLTPAQQALAEAMLGLYLESLALMATSPGTAVLLTLTEAWLSVLHALALPPGFDERLLRATSWYLETYLGSGARS